MNKPLLPISLGCLLEIMLYLREISMRVNCGGTIMTRTWNMLELTILQPHFAYILKDHSDMVNNSLRNIAFNVVMTEFSLALGQADCYKVMCSPRYNNCNELWWFILVFSIHFISPLTLLRGLNGAWSLTALWRNGCVSHRQQRLSIAACLALPQKLAGKQRRNPSKKMQWTGSSLCRQNIRKSQNASRAHRAHLCGDRGQTKLLWPRRQERQSSPLMKALLLTVMKFNHMVLGILKD